MEEILNNITAVTVNWLSAENTKRAVLAFQKFYPDIPVIVIDDNSKEEDKGLFYQIYNGHEFYPDGMYDPDTSKLEYMDGVSFYKVPPYKNEEAKGHGNAVDLAMKHMKTDWMFHFHSDWRMTEPGILEEMTFGIDEKTCGVGDNKTRADGLPALVSVAALYNVKLGKEHHLSFKPVIYYPDGHISPYPGVCEENGIPVEAGSYFIGKLFQLGYTITWIANPYQRYGVHLRWKGDLDEWQQSF